MQAGLKELVRQLCVHSREPCELRPELAEQLELVASEANGDLVEARRCRRLHVGALLAESRLEALGRAEAPHEETTSGTFENGFGWQLEAVRVDQLESDLPAAAYHLILRVAWPAGDDALMVRQNSAAPVQACRTPKEAAFSEGLSVGNWKSRR